MLHSEQYKTNTLIYFWMFKLILETNTEQALETREDLTAVLTAAFVLILLRLELIVGRI